MQWSSAADTHPGNHRSRNEDAVFCSSGRGLWAVADGMGGHKAGDYASEAIAQTLSDLELTEDLSGCVDAIEDSLLEVNDHLRRHARTLPPHRLAPHRSAAGWPPLPGLV